MTDLQISRTRLVNQRITGGKSKSPAETVKWMGAVQAQDYPAALWGVGLRTHGATETSVEQAIAERNIIRTWPMRGTLHFVAPSDVRWMLKYLTPRIVSRGAFRLRQLHLRDSDFSRARNLFTQALVGGKRLTRDAMYALLERHRIPCSGQRGIHILWKLAQEGLICHGPREGKQFTFVLLEEWIPPVPMISREEAIAELTLRYFGSHGPATLHDFTWWSGLTTADGRAGLDAVKSSLVSFVSFGRTYWMSDEKPPRAMNTSAACLLPAYDEFLVGYRDRSAPVDRHYARRMHPGGGILHPTIVIGRNIVGTWRRSATSNRVSILVLPFSHLTKTQRSIIQRGLELYHTYLQKPVDLAIEAK